MFGCLGLDCMGEMTTDQRTKATAMLGTLRNYLSRLEAWSGSGVDTSNAITTLKASIMNIEASVAAGDYEMAQMVYKGAVAVAEKDIAKIQQANPYSQPVVSQQPAVIGLPAATMFTMSNQVAADALSNSVAVAQQSAATQAAFTPATQGIMNAWFAAPAAVQAGPTAMTTVAELQAAQKATQAAQKSDKTLLLVGGAVVGLAIMYFAFKGRG